jgi:opacity protein-like surface antigen
MKKFLLPLFLATALAASAQNIVTGFDVGYLTDADETYTTGRIGWEFKANETFAHQLGLEVGYARATEAGGKATLLPVTANYRLESPISGNLRYFFGVGAGVARVRADGVSTGGPVTLRDTSFAAQGFTGLSWQASPAVALNVGARYIWIDDVKLAGTNVEIGDDIALSAGLSIRF